MENQKTTGKIVNLRQSDAGLLMIAVEGHGGYFYVPKELSAPIIAAREDDTEITFTYTDDMYMIDLF